MLQLALSFIYLSERESLSSSVTIWWSTHAAVLKFGPVLQLRLKCVFNTQLLNVIVSSEALVNTILGSWRCLPCDWCIVSENNALFLGAEVSAEIRTQNNSDLAPLFPGTQVTYSIFQEDSIILLTLGNQLLPMLLLFSALVRDVKRPSWYALHWSFLRTWLHCTLYALWERERAFKSVSNWLGHEMPGKYLYMWKSASVRI